MKIFIAIIISLIVGFIASKILAFRKARVKLPPTISRDEKREIVKKEVEEKMNEIKEKLKTEINKEGRDEILNDIDAYFNRYGCPGDDNS